MRYVPSYFLVLFTFFSGVYVRANSENFNIEKGSLIDLEQAIQFSWLSKSSVNYGPQILPKLGREMRIVSKLEETSLAEIVIYQKEIPGDLLDQISITNWRKPIKCSINQRYSSELISKEVFQNEKKYPVIKYAAIPNDNFDDIFSDNTNTKNNIKAELCRFRILAKTGYLESLNENDIKNLFKTGLPSLNFEYLEANVKSFGDIANTYISYFSRMDTNLSSNDEIWFLGAGSIYKVPELADMNSKIADDSIQRFISYFMKYILSNIPNSNQIALAEESLRDIPLLNKFTLYYYSEGEKREL
ncbi:MAG: hypothetical protein VX642_15855 [Bdellovibrionota bacterium]|nr:hypothetical protein [Bdellovibrionota bacterium]